MGYTYFQFLIVLSVRVCIILRIIYPSCYNSCVHGHVQYTFWGLCTHLDDCSVYVCVQYGDGVSIDLCLNQESTVEEGEV